MGRFIPAVHTHTHTHRNINRHTDDRTDTGMKTSNIPINSHTHTHTHKIDWQTNTLECKYEHTQRPISPQSNRQTQQPESNKHTHTHTHTHRWTEDTHTHTAHKVQKQCWHQECSSRFSSQHLTHTHTHTHTHCPLVIIPSKRKLALSTRRKLCKEIQNSREGEMREICVCLSTYRRVPGGWAYGPPPPRTPRLKGWPVKHRAVLLFHCVLWLDFLSYRRVTVVFLWRSEALAASTRHRISFLFFWSESSYWY